VVEEMLYSALVPLSASHCAMRSSAVIGVPSDQVASGLMSYVICCGSSDVSSMFSK